MHRLRKILEHPATRGTVAIVMIVTSGADVWETFVMDLNELDVGVHHGVFLLGIMELLRALHDFVSSADEHFGRTAAPE